MLITGTSDKIQFKLGANITTTALPFTVDYNNYTSTSVSVLTNNGTSNNTTAVDLVGSPSSGQQNELRYCSIINSDTASATVTIQVYDGTNTRVVFRAVLAVGDMLQYQLEKGWEVIDVTGNKKNYALQAFSPSIRWTKAWKPNSVNNTNNISSGTIYLVPLGRAEKAYTTINVMYNIPSTAAATITWAEMAIYTSPINAPEIANIVNTRAGFTDVSGVWNSTGIKNTAITVSGINPGDRLYLVLGSIAVTNPGIRTFSGTAATVSENTFGTFIGTTSSHRPSTTPYIYYATAGLPYYYVVWQGT